MRFALAVIVLAVTTSSSMAACNYSTNAGTNCGEAAKDWAFGSGTQDQSTSMKDAFDRANSLKGTLQECINCALAPYERRSLSDDD